MKRIMALVIMMAILLGLVPAYEQVSAAGKTAKPGTSIITGEVISNDSDKPEQIRIIISKTDNASGYYIYLKAPGSSKFKKVKNLKKSGKQARKYLIKNLVEGDYQIRVRPYNKENKKTVKGSYSNTVKINISFGKTESGADPAGLEYSEKNYPLIKKMADEGLITLTNGERRYSRDTITFGRYKVGRYSYNKGKIVSEKNERDLEWEVLQYSADGKSALVISKNLITERKYAKKAKTYSWIKSDLRKWLNEDFLNTAFTKEEQELIQTVKVYNDDFEEFTQDKIYILSEEESDYYLYLNALDYGYPSSYVAKFYDGTSWSWFLRDSYKEDCVLGIGYNGNLGYATPYEKHGIRPVFWIELTPELIKNNNLSCVLPAGNTEGKMDIYVKLGKYDFPDSEGNTDGIEEDIEWEILDYDEESGKALLISRYLFRNSLLDTESEESSDRWKYSVMRKWLRNIIYEQAFSDEEKALMSQVTVRSYGVVDAEIETKDKMFLLSYSDVYEYFESDDERIGFFIDGVKGPWALTSDNYVDTDGDARRNFDENAIQYVRPVMYLNLNAGKDSVPEPDAPEYSVKKTINDSGIEINIEKTYLADGYYIYMKAPGQKKYKKVKTVAKDGSKNRYVVLRKLKDGEYSVYVKAYRYVDGKELLSDNNNLNSFTIDGFTESEYAENNYSDLKKLADKGLIGLKFNYEKDCLKLGKWALPYFNDDEDETTKNDLEWVVLDYSDDFKQALVASKYIICDAQFNNEDENVTWDNCSLRKWLNKNFFEEAFAADEQSLIKVTKVKNEDNPEEQTSGGEDTEDRVFLLSISEAIKYYDDENWDPFKDGLYIGDYDIEWLRSPGRAPSDMSEYWDLDPEDRDEEFDEDWMNGYAAAYFGREYGVDYCGLAVVEWWCVRPVFWMDLTPELIEANNLSMDKAERGHYTNVLVEFGSYTIQDPKNIEGKSEELIWELTEYDPDNNRALLVCTSKVAKKDFENDFLKNSFNAEENALIEEISAYEKDSKEVRPAVWIKTNP